MKNKIRKILFVTPPFEKIIEPIYDRPKFIRPSLAYLAGHIIKNSAYEVKCIDAKFERKNLIGLSREIFSFNPDIIGISSYTYEIDEAKKLIKEIRKKLSKVLIVIGGSHITALPKETMENISGIDIGVIGEGEDVFLQISHCFFENRNFSEISGIVFRKKGKILINKKRHYFDLNNYFIPAWNLFPPAEEYFIQFSRGCPFSCNFCFNPNGKTIRYRNIDKIIEEINFIIKKFNPKRISFGDEVFGIDKKKTYELLEKMKIANINKKISWDIQTHVSAIDNQLLFRVKELGIAKIEVGIESGNEEILKNMGKSINKEMISTAFRKIKKFDIKTGAFFIFGHPNETRKTIWDTIKFAAKINPTEPIFAIMVPFPGTSVFEYARKREKGYCGLPKKWSNYRKQINSSTGFKDLSTKRLKYYFIIANIYFFIYNFRFLDLFKFFLNNRESALFFLRNMKND